MKWKQDKVYEMRIEKMTRMRRTKNSKCNGRKKNIFIFMKRAYRLYAVLLLTEIILAVVCGPHSCEWGNGVYFYFGVSALILSFLFPLLQKEWPGKVRIVTGFLFLLGSAFVWCAGFLLGEFRIMCRLF